MSEKTKGGAEESTTSNDHRESTRLDNRSAGNGYSGSKVARTTAVVPEPLNQNWEAYSLTRGVSKNEVLVTALSAFLASEGMEPDKKPKLKVSY
jgi:hypothetical protein